MRRNMPPPSRHSRRIRFRSSGQAEHIALFREGRSTEGIPNPIHEIYLTETNYVYGDLYLNAEGMILSMET